MHGICMAIEARALCHPLVARLDLDWLVKILKRECQRMKKPVVRFRDQMADEIVRQVAVVARRHMAMARILPRVVVALHHVAIRARGRIPAQVTPALAVPESERSEADQDAEQHHCGDCQPRDQTHTRKTWPVSCGSRVMVIMHG